MANFDQSGNPLGARQQSGMGQQGGNTQRHAAGAGPVGNGPARRRGHSSRRQAEGPSERG